MLRTVENVICPGCGCVCDDVTLQIEQNRIVEFQPRCALGEAWFSHHQAASPPKPAAGDPMPPELAIDRAAELLTEAHYPLIYGLSRSVTAGQRAAVALGETVGGVVDSTASLCHGPSIMALQEVGEITSTLGEIRNRADLVIFWGCDPGSSHPRHTERYSVFPIGRFTRAGRADRKIVMIGDENLVHQWRLNSDNDEPDLVIPTQPGTDFEILSQLRALIHGSIAVDLPPVFHQLMDLIRQCRYGVVFFGLGLAKTSMWDSGPATDTGHHDVAALLKLVAELNQITRFTARRMRLQGDVSGADNVLSWQTGYPFGVDFSRGYPRYNPGEYTASELLERGEVDACLLLGAETVQYFPEAAREHLGRIPTILIDYPNAECPLTPTIRIDTAVYGIHAPGTIYRMDNVPMSLQSVLETDLPTDEWVLNEIQRRCPQVPLSGEAIRDQSSF